MQKTIKKFLTLICISLFLLCGQNVYAQQKEIKGTVTDTQGEPLIGVTIAVKGTNKATMTDVDGAYILSVGNEAKTLVATFVGMKSSEKNITGSVMNFVMEDLSSELEEVVVIGYGTVKRKDLTGAVSSIKGDAIQAIPVSNVTEAITGKLAGVQITTTEGSPDAEMKIRVRGGGSITGDNTPLFIVDGFPVQSISDIAPSDIESIDVLKDASSTAIYGSRGANGVVLVTTKSGKSGKINVAYNNYYSWKKIAKTLDVLSPKDYATWQYELAGLIKSSDMSSYTDFFGAYQDIDLYDNIPYNDWQDLTFGRIGHTFNQSLSISGGSEKMSFAFNYSHTNDKAIMQGSNFKRDNLSLKLNTTPAKNVTVDFSVRYADTDINGGGSNDAKSTLDTDKRLGYSVIYTPIPLANLTSDTGSSDDLGNLFNPLVAISDNARKQTRKTLNLAGSFGWEIFDNFRFKTEIGLDDYRNSDNRFWGLTTYYAKNDGSGNPVTRLVNIDRNTLRNTNTINYNFKKLIGKNHHLNILAGQEYIGTKIKTLTVEHHNFPKEFTAEQAWNLSSQGDNITKADDFYNPDDKLLSFFGRANYDWQSKYILNFTFRADGSSKFGKEHRWGYFPSAAAAWRVSSESFMAGTKSWLEDMKLRFSYGTAGNNNIPSGVMIQTFSAVSSQWINGFKNYWAPTKDDDSNVVMANPDLKWETTITRNIGLDFSLLGGKVNGTIDAYLNTTKDLLIQFPTAGTGYTVQYRNMGENRNKGIEATVNWIALDKKDYGLSVSANIGFNKNTIKSLGIMDDFGWISRWASSEINEDFWIAVGGSVGKMYGYRSDGRYEVSDFEEYDGKTWKLKDGVTNSSSAVGTLRPGSMKLKDLNGDNNVTSEDCEIIGDANPLHTGGFTISGRLYGFDLSANFNWSYGNDVYNANKIEYTQTSKYQYRNMSSIMESGKRWTNLRPDGTISNDAAELNAMNANTTMWSPYTQKRIFSDWAVEDGSFLRLNTLTLGYTLPKAILFKAGIQNVRFYVTGYNLLCITGYSGFDPEVSTIRKTNLTPGVDYSAYPKSRQFVIGLNLNF
ncbi:MAG: TonB-dependent receptor [Prevotella sp.]|jgi:TonB-linked SusC/RagA family outer membrane protein|nr:TonB-dependent receptor [Prevotella sp.]